MGFQASINGGFQAYINSGFQARGSEAAAIWFTDSSESGGGFFYEMDPVTMVSLRSAGNGALGFTSIGGNAKTLYSNDSSGNRLYEREPSTFAVLRLENFTTGTFPDGIGGTENVVWHAQQTLHTLYELNPLTWAIVRSAVVGGGLDRLSGAGGSDTLIYTSSPAILPGGGGVWRSHSLATLATVFIRGFGAGEVPTGGGGGGNFAFFCKQVTPPQLFKADAFGLTIAQTVAAPASGSQASGIGGFLR